MITEAMTTAPNQSIAVERTLSIDSITAGDATQFRQTIDEAVVIAYASLWDERESEWPFNESCVVFTDGDNHWLADGFHRYHGAKRAGRTWIQCRIFEGSIEDAQDYALSANSSHGLRRTNEDKRKAVEAALGMDRWARQSNRAIADHVGVGHTFVAKLRNQVESDSTSIPATRLGKDGKSYPTATPTQSNDGYDPADYDDVDEIADSSEPPQPHEPTTASDHDPVTGEQSLLLPDHLELIRAKLLTHFNADELPTSEAHYTAISRLGAEGAIDVVETAREAMAGDTPTLQEYRDAAKSLDSSYAKSILVQHLEAAMRATDDMNRHVKNTETHQLIMGGVQECWRKAKAWR